MSFSYYKTILYITVYCSILYMKVLVLFNIFPKHFVYTFITILIIVLL